jgi:hypothetical protein
MAESRNLEGKYLKIMLLFMGTYLLLGLFCEIDEAVCNVTDESRCMNGGICIEGPGESFTCSCLAGRV